METDPVCGMKVDPAQAAARSRYEGKDYYFCSTSCKEQFDRNPREYVEKQATTQ